MLGQTDLKDPHQIEGLRRSVAMLPANVDSRLLSREELLRLLEVLRDSLHAIEEDSI